MRKLITIFLSLVYLATTSGIVISSHYCMGELKGHAFGQNNDHLCGTCGMENTGCCHDDLNFLKVNDDHHIAYTTIELPRLDTHILDLGSVESHYTFTSQQVDFEQSNAPPERQIDRQVLFCVFRI